MTFYFKLAHIAFLLIYSIDPFISSIRNACTSHWRMLHFDISYSILEVVCTGWYTYSPSSTLFPLLPSTSSSVIVSGSILPTTSIFLLASSFPLTLSPTSSYPLLIYSGMPWTHHGCEAVYVRTHPWNHRYSKTKISFSQLLASLICH